MKKVLLAVVVLSLVANPSIAKLKITKAGIGINEPVYSQLDRDYSEQLKAMGVSPEIKHAQIKADNDSVRKSPMSDKTSSWLNAAVKLKNGIVIPVDFPVLNTEGKISDVPGVNYKRIPSEKLSELLNIDTNIPFGLDTFKDLESLRNVRALTNNTFTNYLKETGYGKLAVDIKVTDWVVLPHNYSYYLGQDNGYPNENGDAHIGELVKDAVSEAAKKGIDFKPYASEPVLDEYGSPISGLKQPNLFIIYRGTGAEYSGDPGLLWSHKWDIRSASAYAKAVKTGGNLENIYADTPYFVVNGVCFNTYNIVPEVGDDLTGYRLWPYDAKHVIKSDSAYPELSTDDFDMLQYMP